MIYQLDYYSANYELIILNALFSEDSNGKQLPACQNSGHNIRTRILKFVIDELKILKGPN